MIIRPVQTEDLQDIMELVSQSGYGLTNLPKDQVLISRRIEEAVRLFAGGRLDSNAESAYLLVMEDTATGRIAGTGGIIPRIGTKAPFYVYCIETHIKESASLGIRKELACLHLLTITDGPSEIGALFVHSAYQRQGMGRLMSLSRFLFLADHRELFASSVIAEMRGVIDENGKSPFWEALGRHFFEMEFARADYLSAKDKTFIAELMPRHPLYVVMLPPAAQTVIGQVHTQTRPALTLLAQEGFCKSPMIDIFDGGPIVRCNSEEIRTVKASKVSSFTGPLSPEEAPSWIISKGRLNAFRACIGAVVEDGRAGVRISGDAADKLDLQPGEKIRYAPLRPEKERTS